MSGGRWDHRQYFLSEVALDLNALAETQDEADIRAMMLETSEMARVLCDRLHHLDYLLCDDSGPDTVRKCWDSKALVDKPQATAKEAHDE